MLHRRRRSGIPCSFSPCKVRNANYTIENKHYCLNHYRNVSNERLLKKQESQNLNPFGQFLAIDNEKNNISVHSTLEPSIINSKNEMQSIIKNDELNSKIDDKNEQENKLKELIESQMEELDNIMPGIDPLNYDPDFIDNIDLNSPELDKQDQEIREKAQNMALDFQ